MFKNLFSYEENENVVEFVEEETIETVEELNTLVDKVINFVQELGQVVVNTGIIGVLLTAKAVKGTAKVAIGVLGVTGIACYTVVTYPIVKPVKMLCNKVKSKKEEKEIKKTFRTFAGMINR